MTSSPLDGRIAVVTGASRGIGAATARALDAAGATVALVARSGEALGAVAQGLAHEPLVVEADLGDAGAPAMVAAQVLDRLGGADVLVNNAAKAIRMDIADVDAAIVDDLFAVNVRAPLLLVGALVGSMVGRGGGSIVNISSVTGLVGTPRRAVYAATKGALDAMTRSLAIELGPSGIRVNAVAPGVVDTALWEKNKAVAGVVATIEAQTPLGRWATPEDIADVIVWLATDGSRFVTGETISADGGMARTLDLFAGDV